MIGPRSMSRHERRQRREEIQALSDRANKLHEQLMAGGELAHETDMGDEQAADELIQIEEYVDLQAKVFDLDDQRTAAELENPRFLELLVHCRWRGVKTVEQASEELLEEVARRSVGKTDLALLLTSIDHTAIALYGRMPDSLRALHGEELVKAGVDALALEDFATTLVSDPRWATMRTRWIRLGWRGAADEASFNRAFVREVVGRVAMIHDAQGDDVVQSGLLILDTVIDKELNKARPGTREKMIQAFAKRLDRECEELLSRRSSKGYSAVLDAPRGELESAVADGFEGRWNDQASAVESLFGDASTRAPAYSDHHLMRHGRELWDLTYAAGMTDEAVRDTLQSANHDEYWSDEVSIFSAKWAVHAFQRLMTSHTFAAALMCSDMQQEVLEGIEEQWDAFLVLVPNGMLLAGGFEFSRVLVATYSFGAWMGLLAPDGAGFRLLTHDAPSLPLLLANDETDLVQDSPPQRCMVLAKRLVAGLLLHLQDATAHKIRKVEARPKSKGREAEPEHRIVTIGAPVDIDCRPAIREYLEHGGNRRHGAPTVQVMVRGHYRMQACGPRHTLRRKTWIRPHWWGSEAALIQTRAKVPS